jgi:multidrug efflux pump subunit AcrA (membrane-fusion protein)
MKLPAVLAGATAGVLLAGLAIAQGPAAPPPPTTTSAADEAMTGRHTMTGEVTSVSPEKGRVLVKTPVGRMLLHFPSAALQNVKKGDSVTVELALRDNGPTAKTK